MKLGNFLMTGLAAGAVILLASNIVNMIVTALFPYDVLSLGGMRAVNDPVMLLFFVYPFVLGFALTYAYSHFNKVMKGKPDRKGMQFGMMMWIVISVPSAFLVFSSMNYPVGFTLNSLFGSLLYMLGAGLVLAKMSK